MPASAQGAHDWHKSRRSVLEGQNCLEQGRYPDRQIAVRDTKDRGSGPVLAFTPTAWSTFLHALKNRRFSTAGT